MSGASHAAFHLIVVAGALLVSAGIYLLLRRGDSTGFFSGTLLIASGINVDLLAVSGFVTQSNMGDILGLLVLLTTVASAGVVCAFHAARRPPVYDPRKRKDEPPGKEGPA